jgi:hypothetical protein
VRRRNGPATFHPAPRSRRRNRPARPGATGSVGRGPPEDGGSADGPGGGHAVDIKPWHLVAAVVVLLVVSAVVWFAASVVRALRR